MKNKKLSMMTFLIIFGIAIAYLYMMAPSPLLLVLKNEFGIVNNDALLNLSVSIIYPMIIIASIVGGVIEQRIGTRKMYIWTLVFLAFGILINYVTNSYSMFLFGRALYGIGYGLGVPFIGSAIMQYYDTKQQEKMNTVNGLFPFIGTVISFGLIVPIYELFENSWKTSFGIWGIGILFVLVLWIVFMKEKDLDYLRKDYSENNDIEKNIYRNLWKRKEIKLLCITFICDFFCYSYIGVILPTLFMEVGNWSESYAGFMSAMAFPAVGIVGALVGGSVISLTGRRKPTMALGQLLKFIGVLIIVFGAKNSVWYVAFGASAFGVGNALWMPGMYTVTMELEDMNSTRVGAAFALILSCGFVSGFISPIIGGIMTNKLMTISGTLNQAASHSFGLVWTLFIFGFVNLIGFICILLMRETGPASEESYQIEPKVNVSHSVI